MVLAQALRSAASRAPRFSRGFQTGRPARGGGHETGGYEDYIHAKHMYNIDKMKNKELKFGLGVSAVVFGGIGIGSFAIWFQQRKTMSG